MKRLLSLVLFLTGAAFAGHTYTPATGPLQLSDGANVAGIITQEIISSGNLYKELAALAEFHRPANSFIIPQYHYSRQPNYQITMTLLRLGQNIEKGEAVINAYVKVIMKHIHNRMYAVSHYGTWHSIFLSGIPNPAYWFNQQQQQEVEQLLTELEQIANATSAYYTITPLRIKAIVESYRHWKRNLAIATAAYLTADMIAHGPSNSTIKMFYDHGFSNSPKMAQRFGENIVGGGKIIGGGAYILGKGLHNWIIAPVAGVLWNGPKETCVQPAEKAAIAAVTATKDTCTNAVIFTAEKATDATAAVSEHIQNTTSNFIQNAQEKIETTVRLETAISKASANAVQITAEKAADAVEAVAGAVTATKQACANVVEFTTKKAADATAAVSEHIQNTTSNFIQNAQEKIETTVRLGTAISQASANAVQITTEKATDATAAVTNTQNNGDANQNSQNSLLHTMTEHKFPSWKNTQQEPLSSNVPATLDQAIECNMPAPSTIGGKVDETIAYIYDLFSEENKAKYKKKYVAFNQSFLDGWPPLKDFCDWINQLKKA